jgi:hypothetical protein
LSQVSRISVKFKLEGLGEAEGVITRVSAPLTVEAILRLLPFEGRAHPCLGGICFGVGLRRGEEKAKRNVQAGSLAYWPMSDSICVFHSDVKVYSPVNVIGRITENVECFKEINSGVKVRIERI